MQASKSNQDAGTVDLTSIKFPNFLFFCFYEIAIIQSVFHPLKPRYR